MQTTPGLQLLLLISFDQRFVTTMDNTLRKRSRVNPQGLETAEKSLLAAAFQADQGQRMQAVFAGWLPSSAAIQDASLHSSF